MDKKWYASKTIWLGIVTMLVAFAPLIAEYAKVVSPDAALLIGATATLVVGILNVVLRVWFTNAPVEF